MACLNKENVLEVSDASLFRLRRGDLSNVYKWLVMAKSIDFTLDDLLRARPEVFWSTLAYSENTKGIIDSVADFYMKVGFFDESAIYLSVSEEVECFYQSVFEKNLLVCLRILSNLPKEELLPTEYADIIYARKILTLPLLVKICAVYANSNGKLIGHLLNEIFKLQPRFYRDLDDFISTIQQFLENAKVCLSDLSTTLGNYRVSLSVQHTVCLLKIVDNAVSIMLSMSSFFHVFQPKSVISQSLINNIPPFMDHVSAVLTDEFLHMLSSSSEGNLLGFLAHKRTLVLQSAMHLFNTLYTLDSMSEKDQFFTIYDGIICKEFAIRFDDIVGLKKEFLRFMTLGICADEHLKVAMKLLDDAYTEKAKVVKTELMHKNILKNIGQPKNSQYDIVLQSLVDLLPNYSPKQIHLCLKQYNYDIERTTYALMEKDEMPFQLRLLLWKYDNFKDVNSNSVVQIPYFTDRADDFNEECLELKQDNSSDLTLTKRQMVTAFNILPSSISLNASKNCKNLAPDNAERTSKLAMLVSKYGGMFDLSDVSAVIDSIDKAQKNQAEELEFNDQLLIKQDLQRRKLMAEKKPLTAEEENALRVTYDRFKYEMSDEDDEDGRRNLDAYYSAKVGKTGRFNKPDINVNANISNVDVSKSVTNNSLVGSSAMAHFFNDVNDDDEFDDTYDDPQLFAVNDNDDTSDDGKQKSSSFQRDDTFLTSREDAKKNTGSNRKQTGQDKRQGSTKNELAPHASGQKYVPPFARSQAQTQKNHLQQHDDSSSSAGEEKSGTAPPPGFTSNSSRGHQQNSLSQREKTQQKSRNNLPSNSREANGGNGSNNAAAGSYTGGKARLNKERNKNKMKQRGADRKMRGGMF